MVCPAEQGPHAEKATTAPAARGMGSWWGFCQRQGTERTGGGDPGDPGRRRLSVPWLPRLDSAGGNLAGLREEYIQRDSKRRLVHPETCARMSTAAPPVTAPNPKGPRRPPTREWVNDSCTSAPRSAARHAEGRSCRSARPPKASRSGSVGERERPRLRLDGATVKDRSPAVVAGRPG